ncbi:MAG: efflux RND transporter periplasmic adaptor subunit [Phycisphaerales bacterium]|nr:efflux RND transporter periplasmic adaptor subunit [Phycisphaerales bacterium]
MRWFKRILLLLIPLILLAAAAGWYWRKDAAPAVSYRTAPVVRGDLVVTIGATGTVEPEEVIDVGAQVAGQIVSFGKDNHGKTIDYGSSVQKGMVLAQIDDTLYTADVTEAEAQLEQAQAGVKRAEADLKQMRAKFAQAQSDWKRAEKLGPSDALAESSYDNYKAVYETADANVSIAEAAIVQAKAAVDQAQSTLKRAQRNLAFCTIRSPVDGVIIDRRVNIGQTVVSSLNAPSLFLIAKDLKQMQVWVAVNEADIGSIRPEQPVTFTVDSFPGQMFHGSVNKVRLNASMTQNVVTYTVEVNTDNANGKLLPYLTANVQFEVNRRDGVLMVPNAALRWTPQERQIAPDAQKMEQPAGPTTQPHHGPRMATLWVADGTFVRPVNVQVGLTDGSQTQVSGDQVKEGMEVVTGEMRPDEVGGGDAAGNNPFAPRIPRRRAANTSVENRGGGGSAGGTHGGGPGAH